MNRILVAALAVFATAIILAAGSNSSPTELELKAYKALASARPSAAAASGTAVASATAKPIQHKARPVVASSGSVSHSSAPTTTTSDTTPTQASTAQATATATATPTSTANPTPTPVGSKVKHVWVIALHGTGYQDTFGPASPATYLKDTLRPKGSVLAGFTPLGKADLPNYLAFASGQPPNADTKQECANYKDFPSSAVPDKQGIVKGDGCVYPNTIITLGDQVSSSGGYWRAYNEDMDIGDGRTTTCRHPANPSADDTLTATDGYATRHDPFVYFHSLLDLGDCIANVKDFKEFPGELKKVKPNFTFIAPNLCDDGTSTADGCGLVAADNFLKANAPKILNSAAFKKDGALIITFLSGSDQATGALVISKYTRKGGLYAKPFDPYGLLHTVEDLLELKTLGKAAKAESFAKLVLPLAF